MKKYLVIYEKTKTGFSAYLPDIPGVAATGTTKSIVEKNIYTAIQAHLKMMREEKMKIPKSTAQGEMMVFE